MAESAHHHRYLRSSHFEAKVTLHLDARVCLWVVETMASQQCFELVVNAVKRNEHRKELFDLDFTADSCIADIKQEVFSQYKAAIHESLKQYKDSYAYAPVSVDIPVANDLHIDVLVGEEVEIEVNDDHHDYVEIVLWRAALNRGDMKAALESSEATRLLEGRRLANVLKRDGPEPDWVELWDL